MGVNQQAVEAHLKWKGKIEIISRSPITNKEQLSLAYTPGVAKPCMAIRDNPELSFDMTRRGNLVAVVTDGSAVLGLGDIGPRAAMPVMEGKCALLKEFAGVDAFPICINSKDTDVIINTIQNISYSFGGINLEDISAPRCFEIEKRLKQLVDIPVFHDDQHGTAIVVLAALINSLKLADKRIEDITVVVNGAGAAGIAISRLLLRMNVGNIILVDINGIIYDGADWINASQQQIAPLTNKNKVKGGLEQALVNSDVFIGVSRPGLLSPKMISVMADRPIIFALANPTPEIFPDEAKRAGAFIVGTGRSDFPNQINNLLAFPGVFKGALAVRAADITENMKLAAARAIADLMGEELSVESIVPDPFERRVVENVSKAVAEAAIAEGIARII